MKKYLWDLFQVVALAFLTPLVGAMLAARPFNAWDFEWGIALTTSASSALLALVLGLLGRLQGNKDRAGFGG